MKKIKSNSAVTIMGLIVTILVLLILTGVALQITIDNTGIIPKTSNTAMKFNYDSAYEELKSKILEAQGENIREEPTLGSIIDFLKLDSNHDYTFNSESRKTNPTNIGNISSSSDLTGNETEIFIIYDDFEFKLDDDLILSKVD